MATLPHLSWSSHPLSCMFIISILQKLPSFHLFHSFPFPHLFPSLYSCLRLFPFGYLLHSLLHLMLFHFRNHHHNHHILCFSFFSLEVNLHTYLTTWLCSCPVGIFFGSHIIIAKIQKIINKCHHKMCNSKINSHHSWFNFFS